MIIKRDEKEVLQGWRRRKIAIESGEKRRRKRFVVEGKRMGKGNISAENVEFGEGDRCKLLQT